MNANFTNLITSLTISITELLQNWQHTQTPYLGQIWHVTVGQWSMFTDLISSGLVYYVADVKQKC